MANATSLGPPKNGVGGPGSATKFMGAGGQTFPKRPQSATAGNRNSAVLQRQRSLVKGRLHSFTTQNRITHPRLVTKYRLIAPALLTLDHQFEVWDPLEVWQR